GLGSKAKKEWIRELTSKHKISFLTLQETKKEMISAIEIKFLWGNYSFEHIVSEALGNSGGILCAWDPNIFLKHHHIISDNFVALFGTWIPKKIQVLIISVYAPQSFSSKCILWNFISSLISRWNGESIVMGDFNEVRCKEERWGSNFHTQGANSFNSFISRAGLYDIQLEGYSFTWVHPSAGKMSKLDRFLVTDGLLSSFPNLSAVCLDKHLSDHRPILLREILVDFGAIPFRIMIRFRKKLQLLKKEIRSWVSDYKKKQTGRIRNLKDQIRDIDILVDQGGVTDDMLLSREQADDLELMVSNDEIRKAVWGCEENKSPGPADIPLNSSENSGQQSGLIFAARPISLIGSIYKVITKILASRLSNLISDLISNVQTAFLPNRQILDGPFIVNEIISRCKIKNKKAMIFKVDFAKAYDSIRWDYLDDVLIAFGFGRKWCSWIQASLRSGKASILVNGSPSSEQNIICIGVL
ncbi:RNA-directed DNA polymerase, eukaryota, partial [Tanacetum coccineum]